MPSPTPGGAEQAPEAVQQRRWSDHSAEQRIQMAAVNAAAAAGAEAAAPAETREGFTVGLDESAEPAPEPAPEPEQQLSRALSRSSTGSSSSTGTELSSAGELRESFSQALEAVGGYGEDETTLPCAQTIENCLPCKFSPTPSPPHTHTPHRSLIATGSF